MKRWNQSVYTDNGKVYAENKVGVTNVWVRRAFQQYTDTTNYWAERATEYLRRSTVASKLVKASDPNRPQIMGFYYSGDLDLGNTWGYLVSHNRDSEKLDRYNFEYLSDTLHTKYGDDFVVVESYSSDLVGWIEWLNVRYFDDDGNLTYVGYEAVGWHEYLTEVYPIATQEIEDKINAEEYAENREQVYTELDSYVWYDLEFADYVDRDKLITAIFNHEYFVTQTEHDGFHKYLVDYTLKQMDYVQDDNDIWLLNPDKYDEFGNLFNDPSMYGGSLL